MALSNGHRLVSSGSLFLWAFTLSTFSLFFAAFYFYFWFCYCSVELLLLLRCSRCCPVGKWNQRGISASERKVCTGRALLKVHFSSSSSSSSSSGCSCVEGKCMCALKILLKDAREREREKLEKGEIITAGILIRSEGKGKNCHWQIWHSLACFLVHYFDSCLNWIQHTAHGIFSFLLLFSLPVHPKTFSLLFCRNHNIIF